MKINKIIISILCAFILIFHATSEVRAKTAGSSAELTYNIEQEDNRASTLQGFLKLYDSPLAPHAQTFIDEADKNGLDWRLVAAISGNESYFGHMIPPASYNGWGYGVYGTNVRYFTSWEEGIAVVSKAIRTDYIDKWGATDIYEIGSIYAEDRAWANKVTHFIEELTEYERKGHNTSLSISL